MKRVRDREEILLSYDCMMGCVDGCGWGRKGV